MYIKNPNEENILETVKAMEIGKQDSLLLMFGEKQALDFDSLNKSLSPLNISFFGGIFPGIIYGGNRYEEGCILIKLDTIEKPILVHGLQNKNFELPKFIDIEALYGEKRTVLTFVDGLTSNIAVYLSKLYNVLGNTVNFIGGGAGSLSLVQQPCVFTNEGMFQDAAIICFLDYKSKMGVRHGWQQLEGPIVATRTEGNLIHELNWQNAFEVYKEVIDQDNSTPIAKDNFFDIAKAYPFGIFKEDSEDIVRDPIAVDENGALVCVGEVPENTVLYILKGEKNALISSAKKAAEDTISGDTPEIAQTLIVDCISRTLFLEDDFSEELKVVSEAFNKTNQSIDPQGILTLGEISSYGEGYLEFFNKTIVIGTFFK